MKTAFRLLLVSLLFLGTASLVNAQISEQSPAVTHNPWTSGAPLPTAVWQPAGTAVLKGEIYVVGGRNTDGVGGIPDTQIYNIATNTWSSGVPLPTATEDGVAAVVKNVLYVIGGYDGTEYTTAVWALNPKTKTWSSKSPMPTLRDSMGVAVVNNMIYVIGGEINGTRLNTVESYNPANDTWTEQAPLLLGKSEPTVGLVGKTIVAADGFSGSDNGDNEEYNTTTNVWTSLKADPTGRNEACGGGIGSMLYVAGGYPAGGSGTPAFDLTESFKPSKKTWTTLAPLPQATMGAGSAVYKGKLYCIGGTSTYLGTVLDNVQIYQP